jgi:predicted ATPase/DNA-binding SARP family transcriptional activator
MEFAILGPLEVRRDGRVVALGGAKPRTLLAVLLLHANTPVSAGRLALALWGDEAPAGAVRTVQVYVSRLRKALGDSDLVATTPAGYRLRVGPGELDAERFGELARAGRGALLAGEYEWASRVLREALGLWRGAPLADVALDAPLQQSAAQLDEQRLVALKGRLEADLRLGRHGELVGELRALVAAHPLEEGVHGLLMEALYGAGRQADALDAYRQARETLVEELGLEPGSALRRLHAAILRQDPALEPPVRPLPRAGVRALPAVPDRTIGRAATIARAAELLRRSDVRLVTLTGVGGVGKTRVALEVAHLLEHEFADGACFVDLAAIGDAEDVTMTVGYAAGVAREGAEPMADALARQLADQQRLFVLDNFEHVMAATGDVGDLLDACRRIKVLATSREPLRLRAEHRLGVEPLDAEHALELLIELARRHDAPFSPARDGSALESICARLDGLPLGLELAAPRLAVLPPAELAERLRETQTALGMGARDAPARQRTLTATLDWSHDLLSAPERAAFAAFSTFAGGATADAAQIVTASSLDVLSALVAKSLLTRRGERLVALKVIRQYAGQRLAASGTADAVRERHAQHYLRLAEEAAPQLVRAGRADWLVRLDADAPNLRAALAWTLSVGRAAIGLRLATALVEYWDARNADLEGVRWIDAALACDDDGDATDAAAGLLARAELRDWGLGDTASAAGARADAERARELYHALGDHFGTARSLSVLAGIAGHCGDMRRSRELAAEALALARVAGDELEIARALARRAATASSLADARADLEPAISAFRAIGSDRYLSGTLSTIGFLAISAGAYHEATTLLTDALPAAERVGIPRRVAMVHGNLGLAALLDGRPEQAESAFRTQLAICANAMLRSVAAEGLAGMAALAAARDGASVAARLSGCAEALGFRATGAETRVYRRLIRRFLEPARAAAGTANWARERAAGEQMDLRAGINYALEAVRAGPRA